MRSVVVFVVRRSLFTCGLCLKGVIQHLLHESEVVFIDRWSSIQVRLYIVLKLFDQTHAYQSLA